MTTVLSVKNIAKSYTLQHQRQDGQRYSTVRDVIAHKAKQLLRFESTSLQHHAKEETFWALNDVSFNVKQGERVGIIGRNGAGKSTLLKIISRITAPTRGHLEITGRVASLLEVGTGFHPELTGRENIFLNGAVLGMSRKDIKRKFDEIVAFADVERFLDTPVKRYSSGMYMRLAFAVAAHLEPDILVIDEVLAVGDAEFQKKCLGKMRDVGKEGRTVLFVSHNMGAIKEFCDRAILMDSGKVFSDGSSTDIISAYSGSFFNKSTTFVSLPEVKSLECQITRIAILDDDGQTRNSFDLTESITLEIDYLVRERLSELQLSIVISKDGIDLINAFDNDDLAEIEIRKPGKFNIKYVLPKSILKEGNYNVKVDIGLPNKLIQSFNEGLVFEVISNNINTLKKSFRADRTGQIISPGKWIKS